MKIELVGTLPDHLKDIGLKKGDRFEAEQATNTRLDAVRFMVEVENSVYCVTVLPKNYRKI